MKAGENIKNLITQEVHCLRACVVEGDTIAIDGKTLRDSRGWNEEDRPLHLLHAWSTELGVCLGQVSVDEKSNEITAFPKLIEKLKLKGTIVTDALNKISECQA